MKYTYFGTRPERPSRRRRRPLPRRLRPRWPAWLFGDFNYPRLRRRCDFDLYLFGFFNQPAATCTRPARRPRDLASTPTSIPRCPRRARHPPRLGAPSSAPPPRTPTKRPARPPVSRFATLIARIRDYGVPILFFGITIARLPVSVSGQFRATTIFLSAPNPDIPTFSGSPEGAGLARDAMD